MTPYRRNIVVGATMLGALVILAWMIIQFGEVPAQWFAPPMMPIKIVTERADGISEGSVIGYRGVAVGRVTKVTMGEDLIHVNIDAQVDKEKPLPANVEGVIKSQVFGGSGILSLQLIGDTPQGKLGPNSVIKARFIGLDFIPPELATLATELQLTARQFRESNVVAHLDQQVQKVGKILDSVDSLISDPKLQENIREAIANIRTAAGQASQTLAEVRGTIGKTNNGIDTFTKQMTGRMEELSRTLTNIESITAKIDKGQGTAGALINDAKLYEALVDTARSLDGTVKDLNRLIQQWEQEGVPFKLGK